MSNRLTTFQSTGGARISKNSARKRGAARLERREPACTCKAPQQRAQGAGQQQRQTHRKHGAGSIRKSQLVKNLAVGIACVTGEQLAQKIALMRMRMGMRLHMRRSMGMRINVSARL